MSNPHYICADVKVPVGSVTLATISLAGGGGGWVSSAVLTAALPPPPPRSSCPHTTTASGSPTPDRSAAAAQGRAASQGLAASPGFVASPETAPPWALTRHNVAPVGPLRSYRAIITGHRCHELHHLRGDHCPPPQSRPITLHHRRLSIGRRYFHHCLFTDGNGWTSAPSLPPLAAQPLPTSVVSTRACFGCRVYESKRCFRSAPASTKGVTLTGNHNHDGGCSGFSLKGLYPDLGSTHTDLGGFLSTTEVAQLMGVEHAEGASSSLS